MSRTYFVAPWDLHRELRCVPDSPADGSVLLVESVAKSRAMPYHRQKLVLVLSAMHHFARALEEDGYDVSVVNAPTYADGIRAHVERTGAAEIHAMRPREQGLERALEGADLGAPITLHDDGGEGGHFLLTRDEVLGWMRGRKQIRMHQFYAWMRKRTGYLMEDGKPLGGKYSFDSDNRQSATGVQPPELPTHPPDALTREVMERVSGWDGHWGEVEGFDWPVTREGALRELDDFFASRAEGFGPYQDAMLAGEPFLWHARISAAMNLSLISPREVCERVADEHASGHMPLASAEGLLRQILGWREFMRGIYLHRMPELRDANLLGADRPLPDFYWEPSRTEMRCVRQSAQQVRETGYAHHIQRLMVLGNFALLAGVEPLEISRWFWAGFVDAYEWVELPNVHGMAVFADPSFTTKPYAASASYVNKMSDYCSGCAYDHRRRTGEGACPFNSLFWRFLARHRERFEANPRMRMLYRTWDRWDDDERDAITEAADSFLGTLTPLDHGWSFDDDAA